MTEYIVIVGRCWMNESGHGTEYRSDLNRFTSYRDVRRHGLKTCGSDDFNIGKLQDCHLVDLMWMRESLGESPELLAQIEKEILL